MTCRGIRPDGNQCECADEYTSPKTGLCASCGAPESTALVPVGSTGLMADPGLGVVHAGLRPRAREFLRAYTETLTIDEAAEVVGMHRTTHYYWLKTMDGYQEAFEIAHREVADRCHRILKETTEEGLRERLYDAKGNLKHTRFRQDAA